MTERPRISKPFRLILPALVILLSALLLVRVLLDRGILGSGALWESRGPRRTQATGESHTIVPSSAPAHAPAATVPPPKPLVLADVPAPLPWARLASMGALTKLDFTIRLDYFAPLGNGPANAAVWFRDFARHDGSRTAELTEDDLKPVKLFGEEQKVYPPDHPLLREAEPWVNQATCRFYPDVWGPAGKKLPIANLLFTVQLAKSWTARGEMEKDPERAKEDFRRAIRLGRLFMQDDYTLIQHLVGWACVSYGLRGLNDVARREGDGAMVAATTLALGDYNAMRDFISKWMTETGFDDAFRKTWWGWSVSFNNDLLNRAIAHARGGPLRCLRAEALFPLVVIKHEGTREQRQSAAAVLSDLASRGKDPQLAALADWLERHPYDRREYLDTQE